MLPPSILHRDPGDEAAETPARCSACLSLDLTPPRESDGAVWCRACERAGVPLHLRETAPPG